MLAQNFKGAEALGIAEVEFEALVKVLGMLERGELVHRVNFDMGEWDCGTVGCIGGSCDRFFGTDFNRSTNPPQLEDLFMVHSSRKPMSEISVEEAAVALRNYLTHGEPRWAEAIGAD